MMWKPISEHYSVDRSRKAAINVDLKACYYFIDFYLNDKYTDTVAYPEKQLNFVERIAEDYVNVSKAA
jgi:hypothetical protein